MAENSPAPGSQAKLRRAIILLAALLLVLLGALIVIDRRGPPITGVSDDTQALAQIGGPFSLVSHTGVRVDQTILQDKVSLLYFGFTYCPDICPTELAKLGAATRLLAARGIDRRALQPLFITVDPERDTPEIMAAYVDNEPFPEGLTGLTGTADEIAAAAKSYRMYYARVDDPDSSAGYTMEHFSLIYLIDREGITRGLFTTRSTPEEMADAIADVLAAA